VKTWSLEPDDIDVVPHFQAFYLEILGFTKCLQGDEEVLGALHRVGVKMPLNNVCASASMN
jgi:hypothetical protein